MSKRGVLAGAAVAALCLISGCHRHTTVRNVAPVLAPPLNAGPVMVSVPPPTHHSTDTPDAVTVRSDIPVVKPVKPPKRVSRRPAAPVVATNTPAPNSTAPTPSAAPTPAVNLGQLTSGTNDPAATRDGAANAIRRERDRLAGISAPLQSAHAGEIEQARRFLKSASDSWEASDYAATLALATKARVLLDDLLK